MNVTASPDFNANADITAGQDGRVYLSWEEDGANWGRPYRARTNGSKVSTKMTDDIGSVHRFRQLHLVEVINDNSAVREIEVPQPSFALAAARDNAPAGIKKLGVFYQSPQLTTDSSNRVWIVYRHFYMPLMGITLNHHMQNDWGIYARCYENGTWSKVFRFDHGQGDALQRIFVSPSADGISVAYTYGRTDRRNPQNYVEDAMEPSKVVKHVSKKRSPSGDDETDEESAKPKKTKQIRTRNQPQDDDNPLPSDGRGVAIASVSLQQVSELKHSSSAPEGAPKTLQAEDATSSGAEVRPTRHRCRGQALRTLLRRFPSSHRHLPLLLARRRHDG